MDTLTEVFAKFGPRKGSKPLSAVAGGGIGQFQDDMIVSKPAIVFYTGQMFFNFLSMACFASVAAFQAKWGVGPSGLSGFTLFITIAGMLLSAFLMLVPVLYEKYDKFNRLARALKEVRVSFILTTVGTTASLLIAFIVTISAFTEPGCKDASQDPHAKEKGQDFQNGLDGWCATKKAASVFLWLAFAFWAASFVLLILDWRNGKLHHNSARDPPFAVPQPAQDPEANEADEDEEDEHSDQGTSYHTGAPQIQYDPPAGNPFADANRYSGASYNAPPTHTPIPATTSIPAGRPSIDAYGAFSDPAPSGFGASSSSPAGYSSPARRFSQDVSDQPRVSRTMQYADPYAAVRASLAPNQYAQSPTSVPPSYDSYQGYQ